MIKIDIKPLSVNRCWQGKRFKTIEYRVYEMNCIYLLPKASIGNPPYGIWIEFGFSNMASDIDNPVKPFLDILQKKYGFNDKDIIEMHLEKTKVKKGMEYIRFSITGAFKAI